MKKQEKIFPTDALAIKEVKENQTVFISRTGRGFLKEDKAREDGSTHNHCECGNEKDKFRGICGSCSSQKSQKHFETLPIVDWDGKSMMCEHDGDRFFSDIEDVMEYLEDNDIPIEEAQIMLCEKQCKILPVNIDELNDEYCTEDGEGVSHYHPEIAKKVDELNKLIKSTEPKLWFQTNNRINLQ